MRFITGLCLVATLTACGKSSGGGSSSSGTAQLGSSADEEKAMLTDTVSVVIVPTYEELSRRADVLLAAVNAFDASRTEANLATMRTAWSDTRSPWEQNEGFLFGPVELGGYDAAIDTWPLNASTLKGKVDSAAAVDKTEDAAIASADANQKGFHAAEYVIFGEDSVKKAAAFTDNEMRYLKAVVRALSAIGRNLAADWSTGQNGAAPFKDTLTSAGEAGNTVYPSRQAAMQTLIEKMAGICHEVGTSKIANPLASRAASDVESQFSYNSLKDFADNVRSVQNVYTGNYPTTGKSGSSLSSLVAKNHSDLDQRVRASITDAITAIQAIPEPFPKTIADSKNDAVIVAAQGKLADLEKLLLSEVEALVK